MERKRVETPKLLKTVKANKVLYNTDHKDFHNPEKKREVWNKVAEKVDAPSGTHARNKWNHHRRDYENHVREEKTGFRSRNKSPMRWAPDMEFYFPHATKNQPAFKNDKSGKEIENVMTMIEKVNINKK